MCHGNRYYIGIPVLSLDSLNCQLDSKTIEAVAVDHHQVADHYLSYTPVTFAFCHWER